MPLYFLNCFLLIFSCETTQSENINVESKPNIILILTDDPHIKRLVLMAQN